VGGTGQYISALLEGWIVPKVPPDINLRQSLERELENNGSDALYQKLIKVAPLAAERINPANSRRIIRALEIFHHNPELIKDGPQKNAPSFSSIIIGIDSTKEFLLPRISHRIEQMLNDGLINEVQQLLNMGFSENLPSMSGIGYKEVINYLNQHHSYETMINIMIKRTRDLVKRQQTWFNALESVNWIPITNEDLSSVALDLIKSKV
jgi:tRNA dimethylallyltransferase